MHKTLDVITIGEAMAMFVATETGVLKMKRFMKKRSAALPGIWKMASWCASFPRAS